jgi:hypothetical protein
MVKVLSVSNDYIIKLPPGKTLTLDSPNSSNTDGKVVVTGNLELNGNIVLNSEAITIATSEQSPIASFLSAEFRSGKLIVQAYDNVTGEVQISELLVVHNGIAASATEYGVIYTSTTPLVVYDVDINNNNVRLLATRNTTNSTQYKISKILVII